MAIWWIHDGAENRDMDAAHQFFKQAMDVIGPAPEQVTTDGHRSYPRAIRETMSSDVQHRTNKYLNNRLEQDHRGIKQRYYPMRGFGSFVSAARFCCDARRIAELFPCPLYYERNGLTPRTTTRTCCLESFVASSLLAKDE